MTTHFTTEKTAKYGLRVFLQGWEPDGQPRAVVCLVHGLGEHSSRYELVAARLNQSGYALLAVDLRGHGKSEGQRGHIDSIEDYLDNIDQLLEEARSRCPGKKLFLYGHSLGGILVLYYSLKKETELAGVIASSPALRTSLEKQKAKILLSRILGAILPNLSFPSGLDPTQLSRDPEVVKAYINDALVHNQASSGFASALLGILPWIFEHAQDFKWPLLIFHGTEDRIAYFSGSQEFAGRVTGDCTLKLWEGLFHETHNEPEREKVFDAIIEWLDARV